MSKPKRIPIGGEYFAPVIREYDLLVDKTEFIQEVIDSGEEAILITRPRRWGKTLNLDMLKTFLSLKVDNQGAPIIPNPNRVLFEGGEIESHLLGTKKLEPLKIAALEDGAYMRYQGLYPVISISFKDVIGKSLEEIIIGLQLQVQSVYRSFRYLETSASLAADEVAAYKKIVHGDLNKIELMHSIKLLSELLFMHHGSKAYILVDEYDKPINHLLEKLKFTSNDAKQLQLIDEIREYVSSFLSSCGKSNPHREKIILTGIFDVLKREGNSGFNNIRVFDVTDIAFHDSFGFTEDEVNMLIAQLGFDSEQAISLGQNIKEWYNGYSVPSNSTHNTKIYTPWAVMNYLRTAYIDQDYQPENYWSQSGASTMLANLLPFLSDQQLRSKFHSLAGGHSESLRYEKQLISWQKYKLEEAFAYILLHSGYLTAYKEQGTYYFRVPNHEVREEFVQVIENAINNIEPDTDDGYKYALLKSFDKLKGSPFRKAIKYILEHNADKLEALFKTAALDTCTTRSSYFHLFHLGALAGNSEILDILWQHCDHRLLLTKDSLSSLASVDYAYLSGKMDNLHWVQEKTPTMLALSVPGWAESFACYPVGAIYWLYNILGVAVLTGGIKLASRNITPRELSFGKALIAASFTDGMLNVAKQVTKYVGADNFGICEGYDIFNAIDTSLVEAMDSLREFEKYILLHPNSYTNTNQPCAITDITLTSIEVPLFFYEDEALTFYLCQSTAKEEL